MYTRLVYGYEPILGLLQLTVNSLDCSFRERCTRNVWEGIQSLHERVESLSGSLRKLELSSKSREVSSKSQEVASKSREVASKSREVNDELTECHKDFGKSDTQRSEGDKLHHPFRGEVFLPLALGADFSWGSQEGELISLSKIY